MMNPSCGALARRALRATTSLSNCDGVHTHFVRQARPRRLFIDDTSRKRLRQAMTTRNYATVSTHTPSVMINDLRHQEVLVNFDENHTVRYPSFWLRDNCRCNQCLHPHTRQRQVDTLAIDPNIQAQEVNATPEGLEVAWSEESHRSVFPWSFLSQYVPFSAAPTLRHPRQSWAHTKPTSGQAPEVSWQSVMEGDDGLQNYLNNIRTSGYSFVDGVPHTPEATEKLLERISFIRPTQYGAFWDFTSEAKPVDTAYTNLALPLHTDTTYFTDPAGLQLFHCLQVATAGGGESTFSDGFAAAWKLYEMNQDYYNILSSVRIRSHASGSAEFGPIKNYAAHAAGFPIFTHSHPHIRPHPKHLTQIRWNNDDRDASTQWPSHERMIMWFRAARVWSELVSSADYQWEVQLEPGRPIIFDNWRVLHGRKAFQGQRRICGGYIGMDEFLARSQGLLERHSVSEQASDDQPKTKEQLADKIKQEQVEEETLEKERPENVEPDVTPQKDEGLDRPIAS